MAITYANVTTSGNTVYTSTGNTAITWLTLTNYSSNAVLVDIFAVPSGDIASNLNIIAKSLELTSAANTSGGDTYQIYSGGEKLLLSNGDFIRVVANANSAVSAVTSYTSI